MIVSFLQVLEFFNILNIAFPRLMRWTYIALL